MKRKNLKSVIHNFSHSFQSFDYRISQYPLFIELCSLYKQFSISHVEVDFIKKTVLPKQAQTSSIQQRVNDYLDWLPELCLSQDVDVSIIKGLLIRVEIGFDAAIVFKSSRNERVLEIKTTYEYLDDRGKSFHGSIVQYEVTKKQNFETC